MNFIYETPIHESFQPSDNNVAIQLRIMRSKYGDNTAGIRTALGGTMACQQDILLDALRCHADFSKNNWGMDNCSQPARALVHFTDAAIAAGATEMGELSRLLDAVSAPRYAYVDHKLLRHKVKTAATALHEIIIYREALQKL